MTVRPCTQFKPEVQTLAFVAETCPVQICAGLGLLCFPVLLFCCFAVVLFCCFAVLLFCCLLAEKGGWAAHSKNSNNAK